MTHFWTSAHIWRHLSEHHSVFSQLSHNSWHKTSTWHCKSFLFCNFGSLEQVLVCICNLCPFFLRWICSITRITRQEWPSWLGTLCKYSTVTITCLVPSLLYTSSFYLSLIKFNYLIDTSSWSSNPPESPSIDNGSCKEFENRSKNI